MSNDREKIRIRALMYVCTHAEAYTPSGVQISSLIIFNICGGRSSGPPDLSFRNESNFFLMASSVKERSVKMLVLLLISELLAAGKESVFS